MTASIASAKDGVIARARSFLFVPGDRPEWVHKALASAAHAVIVDLEDAVAPTDKRYARRAIAEALAPIDDRSRLMLRINGTDSAWHEEDVEFIACLRFAGIVVPKAEEPLGIELAARRAAAPVVPLVESAQGLFAIDQLAHSCGVVRIAFGHLDFQLDTGIQCGEDERELDIVRLAITLASRRAGLGPPIDGVTTAVDDEARLQTDASRSKRLGYRAKLCVHPKQVEVINRAFAPSTADVTWARRVFDAAQAAGGSAFRLDNQMIDIPVIQRARTLLDEH
ncbi:HpcH/HpaI aldolase/citrate lyase family protein [Bradyrhizobium tunisiense]|uniref:HpcH/HpaI aldolase/citrate lyase family protein n=1 Tax=Bradyrhizobium tunisiense TaxID=3278709 RepID=UPI0035DE04B7